MATAPAGVVKRHARTVQQPVDMSYLLVCKMLLLKFKLHKWDSITMLNAWIRSYHLNRLKVIRSIEKISLQTLFHFELFKPKKVSPTSMSSFNLQKCKRKTITSSSSIVTSWWEVRVRVGRWWCCRHFACLYSSSAAKPQSELRHHTSKDSPPPPRKIAETFWRYTSLLAKKSSRGK